MPDSSSSRFSLSILIPIILVAVVLIALVVLVAFVGRDPVVTAITPGPLEPGQVVVVRGKYLGDRLGTITIAGRAVAASSFDEWTDEEIRFRMSDGMAGGILYVVTERGSSDGVLIQVAGDMPVSAIDDAPGMPYIGTLESEHVVVGGLVTISGRNFGANRNYSSVDFPGAVDCARLCEANLAYVEWTDKKIVVRVPDGAIDGLLRVTTPWGVSNPVRMVVDRPAGELVLSDRREIGIQYRVQIQDIGLAPDADEWHHPGQQSLTLRLPWITESPEQRNVRVVSARTSGAVTYDPALPVEIIRYDGATGPSEDTVMRTVLVDRYAVTTRAEPARISASYEKSSGFFEYYTRPLPHLPVGDEGIESISTTLRRNQPNPYRLANLAYEYTLEHLTYVVGPDDSSVLSGLASGYGDDFTYASLFVTLARVSGVPARVVGGVVLSGDTRAHPHFWGEFFIPTIGWIPVDPAFGDGGFPGSFPIPDDAASYYFGGLDAHRVTFLRGYDPDPISSSEYRLVSPDDPYAIQAVYAEVGPGLIDPVIWWETPRPTGVYAWTAIRPAD